MLDFSSANWYYSLIAGVLMLVGAAGTGLLEQGVLDAPVEPGHHVHRPGAGDQARGARSRAIGLERPGGRLEHRGVVPQRQVVVAGEVDADAVELVVDGRAGEAQLFAALCGVAQEDGVLIDLTAADGRIRWG